MGEHTPRGYRIRRGPFVEAEVGPLQFYVSRSTAWVRLFGRGVRVKDIKLAPMLFSERHRHEGRRIGRVHIKRLGRTW